MLRELGLKGTEVRAWLERFYQRMKLASIFSSGDGRNEGLIAKLHVTRLFRN
jgi:hypothetical protein